MWIFLPLALRLGAELAYATPDIKFKFLCKIIGHNWSDNYLSFSMESEYLDLEKVCYRCHKKEVRPDYLNKHDFNSLSNSLSKDEWEKFLGN
jgi:hypothetical protein